MGLEIGEYVFTCDECHGSGTLSVIQPDGDLQDEDCFECDGSGQVTVDEDDAAEKIKWGQAPLSRPGI